jgi:hypothetical protein
LADIKVKRKGVRVLIVSSKILDKHIKKVRLRDPKGV